MIQGGQYYGFVGWLWQLTPCPGLWPQVLPCNTTPVNDTRRKPDAAAIGHPGTDTYPFNQYSLCNGAQKPVRRLQYGVNNWVSGPTGVVRIPSSTCSSCLVLYGSVNHAKIGGLWQKETTQIITSLYDYYRFKQGPLGEHTMSSVGGDSGAVVIRLNSRDLVGLHIAGFTFYSGGYYQRLDYIKEAFYMAGVSYDHYWGTDITATRPSLYTQDNPC